MSAVVHQGGAGTMAAGLRAGVPLVLIPFFSDQPFWARRVANLGVGPAPIPRRQLTAERLAQAIAAPETDEDMRQRAVALGQRIRMQDGVGEAVTIIGAYLDRQTTASHDRAMALGVSQ
jgi:UDP:flavonoid glycosyltransferase YjiC (YdhE family)